MIRANLERQGETVTLEEAAEIAAVGRDPTLRVEFQTIGSRGLPADSLVNRAIASFRVICCAKEGLGFHRARRKSGPSGLSSIAKPRLASSARKASALAKSRAARAASRAASNCRASGLP